MLAILRLNGMVAKEARAKNAGHQLWRCDSTIQRNVVLVQKVRHVCYRKEKLKLPILEGF